MLAKPDLLLPHGVWMCAYLSLRAIDDSEEWSFSSAVELKISTANLGCKGLCLFELFVLDIIAEVTRRHCVCLWQPATVSRCGMIYLEPSTLGWHPMLKSWVNTLPQPLQTEEHLSVVFAMFHWLVDPCVTFVKKSCKVFAHYCIYEYRYFHAFIWFRLCSVSWTVLTSYP